MIKFGLLFPDFDCFMIAKLINQNEIRKKKAKILSGLMNFLRSLECLSEGFSLNFDTLKQKKSGNSDQREELKDVSP